MRISRGGSTREHLRVVEQLLQRQHHATSRRTLRPESNRVFQSWPLSWQSPMPQQRSSRVTQHRYQQQLIGCYSSQSCGIFRQFATIPEIPPDENNTEETQTQSTMDATHVSRNRPLGGTRRSSSTTPTATKPAPLKTKSTSGGGGNNRSPPRLLQLQNLHPRDVIEQQFDILAAQTEVSKLSFVSNLRKELNKVEAGSKVPDVSYWKVAQDYISAQKSLPGHVKNGFWNMIVAPTTTAVGKRPTTKPHANDDITISKNDVEILVEAREKAAQQPMFWNHKEKNQLSKRLLMLQEQKEEHKDGDPTSGETKKKTLQKELLDKYMEERSQHLTRMHKAKNLREHRKIANQLALSLRSNLPNSYYQKLMSTLNEYCSGNNQASKKLPHLYAPLSAAVHGHIHRVAPDLVKFFYLATDHDATHENEKETSTMVENDKDRVATIGAATAFDDPVERILSSDDKVAKSRDKWNEARNEFVEAFQYIQNLLIEEQTANSASVISSHKNEHETADDKEEDEDDARASDDDELGEEDEDYDIADADDSSIEDENENLDDDAVDDAEDNVGLVYDDSEESVMATFLEAAKAPSGIDDQSKKLKLRPRRYIAFEAISVEDLTQEPYRYSSDNDTTKSLLDTSLYDAPTDRLVFIDNLPIDITEDKLLEAYSRCGPIDSIAVYQQRPDLDPGRKLEDSKKKIRKPSMGRKIWQRSRTPLYASILYRDQAGAQKATGDPLRIFGMVIDKHLIRSYPACDMTKLYLEDIAAKHDISSIEYELSQILHPTLYVCLDVDRGRRQTRNRGSLSCEIKFPNFESAYWAHAKMSSELIYLKNEDECSLHWMRTPNDAILFWTRQLNY